MCSMAGPDGRLRASRRDLYGEACLASNSGVERSIEYLASVGLIDILDSGIGDRHSDIEDRKKGKAGRYYIRQQGSPFVSTPAARLAARNCCAYFVVSPEGDQRDEGRSPLPNIDHRMDIFGDEPHLLRLIDILTSSGADGILASPTAISTTLGLSMGGAFEMIRRWKDRGLVRDDVLYVEDVLYFGRGWQRLQRITTRIVREVAVRAEALAGRWVPRRMRIAQRLYVRRTQGKRWPVIDYETGEIIRNLQAEKAARGAVPWLSASELVALTE